MILYPHQQTMSDFIVDTPKCAVWASVGSGKTGGTLHALKRLLDTFEVAHILIVGPKRVVADVWPDEIADWGLKLSYVHLTGGPADRITILRQKRLPEITFITPDLMPWLRQRFKDKTPPWTAIVVDESSMFGESSTQRFRGINPFCQFARRVVELTGTPASNGLTKLWSQMFLLDRGAALGTTLGNFRSTYFTQNIYTTKFELRPGMDKAIHKRVTPLVLRIDAADHMTLPETMSSTIKIHLPPALMQKYRQFEEEFLYKLANGGVLAASNAGAISGKCRQLCAGAIYDEHHNWHHVHDLKLDALDELLTALDGEPLLLFYQFVSDAERIKARFSFAKRLDDPGALDAWRKGEVRMLIAHPGSGGHGLNIHQGGAKHTAYFGIDWSLERMDQSAGRLNGARAKETSYIHYIIAAGTIEEKMVRVLSEKSRTQADLLAAVKRPIQKAA